MIEQNFQINIKPQGKKTGFMKKCAFHQNTNLNDQIVYQGSNRLFLLSTLLIFQAVFDSIIVSFLNNLSYIKVLFFVFWWAYQITKSVYFSI